MAAHLPPGPPAYSPRIRLVALSYGVLCHGLFALAITAMVGNLYVGIQAGLGPRGAVAWLWNLALLAQFPLLHSALLTPRGRALLRRLAPRAVGSTLDTTLYATVAAAQVLAIFALWSPLPHGRWTAPDGLAAVLTTGFALSWLALLKAMAEAGMGVQIGATGWLAIWRQRRPRYPRTFAQTGLHALLRHPIYAAFALVLWTGPHWSVDRLLLAVPLSLYCLFGPRLKEARYRARYGTAYTEHLSRTGLVAPRADGSRRSSQ